MADTNKGICLKERVISVLNKIQKVLENKFVVPVIFVIGLLCWLLKVPSVGICILACSVCIILLFCDDVKNIFAIIIYAPFFIADIGANPNWNLYFILIGCVIGCITVYIIKILLKNRKGEIYKGKMFWAFVVASIVMFLGGVDNNFNIISSLIFLGACIVAYCFYFISLNFSKGLKEYFFEIIIEGSCVIFIVMMVTFFVRNDQMGGWIGSQNVNVAALFLGLGVIACYEKSIGKKYDWAFLLLIIAFNLAIVFSRCRLIIILILPVNIFFYVKLIKASIRKRNVLYATAIGVVAVAVLYLLFRENINEIFDGILNKSKLSGRDELWSWCLEKFALHPIFGYGFMSKEPVPALPNVVGNLILAHNTAIQWLACTGIVGVLGMGFLYFNKYKILFKKPFSKKFFVLVTVLFIEISGSFDQAAAMDIFVFVMISIFIAIAERENKNQLNKENFKGEIKNDIE